MKNQSFFKRLGFAINGIRTTFQREASFRYQTLAAIAVLFAGSLLQVAPIWWALLLLTIGGVLSAELINTALENLMDRVHPQEHPSIKIAKDCAAGAVLVFSLISTLVFLFLLLDKFVET